MISVNLVRIYKSHQLMEKNRWLAHGSFLEVTVDQTPHEIPLPLSSGGLFWKALSARSCFAELSSLPLAPDRLEARPTCIQVPADPAQGLAPRAPGFPPCHQCLEKRTSPRGNTNPGPGPVPKGLQTHGDWTHTALVPTTVEVTWTAVAPAAGNWESLEGRHWLGKQVKA